MCSPKKVSKMSLEFPPVSSNIADLALRHRFPWVKKPNYSRMKIINFPSVKRLWAQFAVARSTGIWVVGTNIPSPMVVSCWGKQTRRQQITSAQVAEQGSCFVSSALSHWTSNAGKSWQPYRRGVCVCGGGGGGGGMYDLARPGLFHTVLLLCL